MQLEKSLSPNSVEAYLRDINKFVNYLKSENISDRADEIQVAQLEGFVNVI